MGRPDMAPDGLTIAVHLGPAQLARVEGLSGDDNILVCVSLLLVSSVSIYSSQASLLGDCSVRLTRPLIRHEGQLVGRPDMVPDGLAVAGHRGPAQLAHVEGLRGDDDVLVTVSLLLVSHSQVKFDRVIVFEFLMAESALVDGAVVPRFCGDGLIVRNLHVK